MTENSSDFLFEAELAASSNGACAGRMSSAAYTRRNEQLKRWTASDTNKEPSQRKRGKSRVNFDEDYVFLSACQAADYDEISRLLKQGADINTCNVDGLTALHQACIDGKIDLVRFLIDDKTAGADVNRGDNEGWTPLHATASCGFIDIAELLVARHARLDLVNNDGDLAVDIADEPSMQQFLSNAMMRQGIDADKARSLEENQMLQDSLLLAQLRQHDDSVPMPRHSVTGATPLHVAAAKGYHQVMLNLLRTNGADPNAVDNDGWTPFLAAAHWGQRESCRILAEHGGCSIDAVTYLGQSALDLAHEDLIDYLTELQKRYASTKRKVLQPPATTATTVAQQTQANGAAEPTAATAGGAVTTATAKRIRPTPPATVAAVLNNKENSETTNGNIGRTSPTARTAAAAAAAIPSLQRQTSVTRVTQDEKKTLHRVEANMERTDLEQAAASPPPTVKVPIIRMDSSNQAATSAGPLRSRALLSNREATPVAQRTLMNLSTSSQQSPQMMAPKLRSKSIDASGTSLNDAAEAKPPLSRLPATATLSTSNASKGTSFTQPLPPPPAAAAGVAAPGVTPRRPAQLPIPPSQSQHQLPITPTKTSGAGVSAAAAPSTPRSIGSLENLVNANIAQLDADSAAIARQYNSNVNSSSATAFMQANAASSTHKLPLLPGGKLRVATTPTMSAAAPNEITATTAASSSSSSTSPAGSVTSGPGAPPSVASSVATTTLATHVSRPLISPLHTVTVRRSILPKTATPGKEGTAAAGAAGSPSSSEQMIAAESESQRKAHARRVRETRRSTQGVSAEDVKNAQIELEASTNSSAAAKNGVASKVAPSPHTSTSVNLIPPIAAAVAANGGVQRDIPNKPATPEPVVTLRLPPQRPAYASAEKQNLLRTPSSGARVGGGGSSPDSDQTRGSTSTSAAVVLTTNAVQRRRRPKRRSTGVVSAQHVVQLQAYPSTTATTTSKSIPAVSLHRLAQQQQTGAGSGDANTEDADNGDDNDSDDDEGEEVGEGTSVLSAKQTSNNSDNRISSLQDQLRQKDMELQQTKARLKQILSMSASSVPSLHQQQTASRQTPSSSTPPNRRLPPPDNTVASTSGTSTSGTDAGGAAATAAAAPATMSAAARQDEKMALIKRLSELEEQIKELERLKSDNQRLKDENSALIRVISKLSK